MRCKIHTPRVPNFIKTQVGDYEGYQRLTQFTDSELEQVAAEWKLNLFKRREQQKKEAKDE